jgi:hypothetical protein
MPWGLPYRWMEWETACSFDGAPAVLMLAVTLRFKYPPVEVDNGDFEVRIILRGQGWQKARSCARCPPKGRWARFALPHPTDCASEQRHPYWSDGSENGERDGLATGLAAALDGGRALSVAGAGFGLAAGAAVAGARTIGFAGVAASGSLGTAGVGFGPAVNAAFVDVIDLAVGAARGGAFTDVTTGLGVAAGAAIAGGGATGHGAVTAAGSGAFPDGVAGFGLIAGATVLGSGAPL